MQPTKARKKVGESGGSPLTLGLEKDTIRFLRCRILCTVGRWKALAGQSCQHSKETRHKLCNKDTQGECPGCKHFQSKQTAWAKRKALLLYWGVLMVSRSMHWQIVKPDEK